MKYSININQLVLAQNPNLDIVDAAILEYIRGMCNSKNPAIHSKKLDGYTWINFKHLISEMPLLRINSKGAITARLNKLVDAGYILTKKDSQRNLFVDLTAKIDELETTKPIHQNEQPIHQNEQPIHQNEQPPVHENEHNHTTNIKHTIIKEDKKKNNIEKLEAGTLNLTKSQKVKLAQKHNTDLEVVEIAIMKLHDFEMTRIEKGQRPKYTNYTRTLDNWTKSQIAYLPDWKKKKSEPEQKYASNREYTQEELDKLLGGKNG